MNHSVPEQKAATHNDGYVHGWMLTHSVVCGWGERVAQHPHFVILNTSRLILSTLGERSESSLPSLPT